MNNGNNGKGIMKLPSELLTQEDIDRINKMFASPKRRNSGNLKYRNDKLQQKKDSNDKTSYLGAWALLCPVISKYFYNVRTSQVDPALIRHDESYMGYRPAVSTRFPEATAMIYHTLTIGQEATNDVYLGNFGYCNYVSPRHAVIFYNETLENYELLNYSCHGTFINSTLYGNNEQMSDTYARQKRKKKIMVSPSKKHVISAKMFAIDRQIRMQCSCTSSHFEIPNSTWEGSIIIAHGSVLRFGCICFVFSLVSK